MGVVSMRLGAFAGPNTPQRFQQVCFDQYHQRASLYRPVGPSCRRFRPACPSSRLVVSTECGGGGRGDFRDSSRRWWNSDGGGPSGFRTSLLCLLFACQALEAQAWPKRSRSKRQQSAGWRNDADINQYATTLNVHLTWPLLQHLGFSCIVGVVCATALKAMGKAVVIGLGTMFIVLELLGLAGFATMQNNIHEDILRACGVDDVKHFGPADMEAAIGSFVAMQGLPTISGFCLGFVLGLRF